MQHHPNHLRTHRRQSGLSQHDVGTLIGYEKQWQVSRHERASTDPPLFVAIAYEVVFHVPVSTLFANHYADALQLVEERVANLESSLRLLTTAPHVPKRILHKVAWISKRSPTKPTSA
jgi:DNA-binding XRE family transcriptional regulator